jgi:hypothetical protein
MKRLELFPVLLRFGNTIPDASSACALQRVATGSGFAISGIGHRYDQ